MLQAKDGREFPRAVDPYRPYLLYVDVYICTSCVCTLLQSVKKTDESRQLSGWVFFVCLFLRRSEIVMRGAGGDQLG